MAPPPSASLLTMEPQAQRSADRLELFVLSLDATCAANADSLWRWHRRRPKQTGHPAFGPSSSVPSPLRSCFIWAITLVMASASWRRAGFKYSALISLAIISLEPVGGLNDLVRGVKVQVTGRLRRCRPIKRRSSAPQRAASLTLVAASSFAGVT